MFGALLYLQLHSVKNRLVFRFKRLRQPKYLFGAVFGLLYFYFYFLRYAFGAGSIRRASFSPETAMLLEAVGAFALFTLLLGGWFFPRDRAALSFTEAEVAFLFPAPVSRRNLIHFRVVRAQAGILIGSFILMLVTGRLGGHLWTRAIGWWLILSFLNLHLIAAAFTRTRLLDRGITTWQRRTGILILVLLAVVGTVLWARHTLPPPSFSEDDDLNSIRTYVIQALNTGPAKYLLFPTRLIVRPYIAPNASSFLLALGPALLLLAVHYLWVIRSNVAFEEASVEASKKLAVKTSAVRSGQWRNTTGKFKRKRAPFALAPVGFPSIAFLWKNLISAGQGFSPRIWILLAIGTGVAAVSVRGGSGMGGLQGVVGMLAGMFLIWSLLLGPQIFRHDFRQDMPLMDVLKSYPLPGWQIALGQILAPAAVIAAAQWLLLILVVAFTSPQFSHNLTLPNRLSIALGAAVLLPALDLVILQIPNAAVLLFPAWFQSGKDAPQGIEATGERIILMLGSLLACVISLIPAGIVFAVVFFLMQMAISPFAAFPVGAAAAALVLLAEAVGGIFLLGWLFERFDFSSET